MTFTLQEIASSFGWSERTLARRIAEIREAGKFQKCCPGRFYNETDVERLARLLNFTVPTELLTHKNKK